MPSSVTQLRHSDKAKHSGGAPARNLRYEVLERIAGLGTGLTPAQKNDWEWFREDWDVQMREEDGVE